MLAPSAPRGWGTFAILAVAWLALVVATSLHRPDFLSHQTTLAIAFTMSIVGVLAIGQAIVAISGGFLDLSQPSCLILASLVTVRLAEAGVALPIIFVAAVLSGVAWGALNATIIVFAKLNPIIVTLATNFIGLAVLFLVFQLAQVPLRSGVHDLGRTIVLGLPAIWWPMVILILVTGYFLPRTRFGRRAIAVGGNRFSAQVRGISLRKTRYATFMAAGGFVGFGAVLFAASVGPFDPGAANNLLLNVIAAVILAGVSLAGGQGNLWGLFLSVGFLSTIPTSLVFFGFSSDRQTILQGMILVIAVALDGYRARRTAR
jgi:ribose transport system permease protein